MTLNFSNFSRENGRKELSRILLKQLPLPEETNKLNFLSASRMGYSQAQIIKSFWNDEWVYKGRPPFNALVQPHFKINNWTETFLHFNVVFKTCLWQVSSFKCTVFQTTLSSVFNNLYSLCFSSTPQDPIRWSPSSSIH